MSSQVYNPKLTEAIREFAASVNDGFINEAIKDLKRYLSRV